MTSIEVAVSIADIVSSLFRIGKIIEYRAGSSLADALEHLEIISSLGASGDVEAAESQLFRTLQEGPQLINIEYIAYLHSVGPQFARGDGMPALLHEAHT